MGATAALAAAVAGSAVVGAGSSLYGSSQASGAAKSAAGLQQQQYGTTRGDLVPYIDTGNIAERNALSLATNPPQGPDYLGQAAANMPGTMTQAELEQTPGYQFNLSQGLKATQSAAAARGLGVSGASLKGAAKYATGLADSTYQNQFNNAQTRFQNYLNLNTGQQGNLQNQFSRLNSLATIGEAAGAGLGAQGTQAASTSGNYLNQAGLASAVGTTGVTNALTGGVNSYLGYNTLQGLIHPTTGGYTDTTSTMAG